MLDKFDFTKPFQSALEYPKEYNPKVHGPYNPAKYYGKPDPLGEVKIGELGEWIGRRNFSLKSMASALSRASWRYRMKYTIPKNSTATPVFHFIFVAFVGSYIMNEYSYRSQNGYAKYH